MTIGGGAVRFPIEAGGALKDIIEAPSLDVVRELDARTNIGYAVEAGAGRAGEPEVCEIHPLDAGHFAWEQAPKDYGRLVAEWVGGGYRRVAAAR